MNRWFLKHPEYPQPVDGDNWSPNVDPPLRSAYKVLNGVEPDFTNYAKTVDSPMFIDSLDYIFMSDEWNVESVEKLSHRDEIGGPLPNKDEPSDHVLIAANLTLN